MTITDLINAANVIKNETVEEANSANRIGVALNNIINFFFQYLTQGALSIDLNYLYTPKDSYENYAALALDFPDGAEGIYLTTDTGHWWWWDTLLQEWKDGGQYQAALDIANELGTSETKVINQKVVSEHLVMNSFGDLTQHVFTPVDIVLQNDGTEDPGNTYYSALIKHPINPLSKYFYTGSFTPGYGSIRIAFYDENEVYIDSAAWTPSVTTTYNQEEITDIPSTARFMSMCGGSTNPIKLHYREYLTTTVKSIVENLNDNRIINQPIENKNLIIPDECTVRKYISNSSGTLSNSASAFVTGFIEWGTQNVLRFKTDDDSNRTIAYVLQYDADKNPITASFSGLSAFFMRVEKYTGASFVKATCFVGVDVLYNNPLRWMGYFGNYSEKLFEPYYSGKLYNLDADSKENYFNPDPTTGDKKIKYNYLRVSRTDTKADYYGLNAIGDCLAAITDNSYYNRYKLIIDGYFDFKATTDFVYKDEFNEWSVLISKKYVDVEGLTKEKFVISVQLPDNLAVDYGKYQPVMWNYGTLKNLTVIAKNCRYALHIEGNYVADNTECHIENLSITHLGNYGNAATSQGGSTAFGSPNAIGAGIRDGQKVFLKNCLFNSVLGAGVHFHSPLTECSYNYSLDIDDCVFKGKKPIGFNTYPTKRRFIVNVRNPKFLGYNYFVNGNIIATGINDTACYNDIDIYIDNKPMAYALIPAIASGLKIASKTTGVNSIVTVDETCTAFGIIGNATETIETETKWLTNKKFGYEYRNGAVGTAGFLIGWVDVNATVAAQPSLGKILGDCSSVNKTLSVTVDGTAYDVVFSSDCTALTNAQVITLITNVIGAVATVEVYKVGNDMYPEFKGVQVMTNGDTAVITAGMGLILNASGSVIRAFDGPGFIDGISIDTAGVGQKLRMIPRGSEIYAGVTGYRFSVKESAPATHAINTTLAVNNDTGEFTPIGTPVIRIVDTNIFRIL